jgi:hypothetical protein
MVTAIGMCEKAKYTIISSGAIAIDFFVVALLVVVVFLHLLLLLAVVDVVVVVVIGVRVVVVVVFVGVVVHARWFAPTNENGRVPLEYLL